MTTQAAQGYMPPVTNQPHSQTAATSAPGNDGLTAAFSNLNIGQQPSATRQPHHSPQSAPSHGQTYGHGLHHGQNHTIHNLPSPPITHDPKPLVHQQHHGSVGSYSQAFGNPTSSTLLQNAYPTPAQTPVSTPSPHPAYSPAAHAINSGSFIAPYNPADPSNGKPTFAPPPTVPTHTPAPVTAQSGKTKSSFFSKMTKNPMAGVGAGLVGGLTTAVLAHEGKDKIEEWTKQKMGSIAGAVGLGAPGSGKPHEAQHASTTHAGTHHHTQAHPASTHPVATHSIGTHPAGSHSHSSRSPLDTTPSRAVTST
ncbi:hypothetical protein NPX13_g9102 [Xylaria arbuscula]|uniref:Uncharacterized protein n=1 Tax=Xylaria arbuscula TaxID=114810 RepID=A0A9W8N772_9PEZI|nr:hypothetical protein NPX13_g9102 [Xylaria arbuscula]